MFTLSCCLFVVFSQELFTVLASFQGISVKQISVGVLTVLASIDAALGVPQLMLVHLLALRVPVAVTVPNVAGVPDTVTVPNVDGVPAVFSFFC